MSRHPTTEGEATRQGVASTTVGREVLTIGSTDAETAVIRKSLVVGTKSGRESVSARGTAVIEIETTAETETEIISLLTGTVAKIEIGRESAKETDTIETVAGTKTTIEVGGATMTTRVVAAAESADLYKF